VPPGRVNRFQSISSFHYCLTAGGRLYPGDNCLDLKSTKKWQELALEAWEHWEEEKQFWAHRRMYPEKTWVHSCARKLNIESPGFHEKFGPIQETWSHRRDLMGQFECSSWLHDDKQVSVPP